MSLMRFAVLTWVIAWLLSGCSFDVSFTQDTRLELLAPEPRATVQLPVDIRWEVEDFKVTGPEPTQTSDDAGYFVLFLDRSPIAPGKDLRSVAEDDPTCLLSSGCPDEDYLNQRHIYTTTDMAFTLNAISDTRPRERPEAKDWHEATLVLVDPSGRRIGESATSVRFIVDRSTNL